MNFELNDEQSQLHDSVRRMLADHFSFEKRRAIVAGEGRSATLWNYLAELGVSALLVPEAQGGLGGRAEDLLPVMQACGEALSTEPVLASAVLCTTALAGHANSAAAQAWLPLLASGEAALAWAHDEPGTHHADHWVETRAKAQADGSWSLSGRKIPVLGGPQATAFVVSARVSGQPGEAVGTALFVIQAQAAGLTRRDFRLVDDSPASELTLAQVAAQPLGDPQDHTAQRTVLQRVSALGIAALCADMLGAAEAAYRLALEYLNVRKQFGRLIGENQALRHRAVDMLVSLESVRAMALAAAAAADRPEQEDSAAELLRAKLVVGKHARLVCQHAVQCHGGIGMTEEYKVGHCLRRVHVADHLLGDVDTQARRLAALGGGA